MTHTEYLKTSQTLKEFRYNAKLLPRLAIVSLLTVFILQGSMILIVVDLNLNQELIQTLHFSQFFWMYLLFVFTVVFSLAGKKYSKMLIHLDECWKEGKTIEETLTSEEFAALFPKKEIKKEI